MSERVRPPGAYSAGDERVTPQAGHAVVVAVCIALAVVLFATSGPAGGTGLIALLMLLLAVAAVIVPIALMAMLWPQAGSRVRGWIALACLVCLVVIGFAVADIVEIAPTVLSVLF